MTPFEMRQLSFSSAFVFDKSDIRSAIPYDLRAQQQKATDAEGVYRTYWNAQRA